MKIASGAISCRSSHSFHDRNAKLTTRIYPPRARHWRRQTASRRAYGYRQSTFSTYRWTRVGRTVVPKRLGSRAMGLVIQYILSILPAASFHASLRCQGSKRVAGPGALVARSRSLETLSGQRTLRPCAQTAARSSWRDPLLLPSLPLARRAPADGVHGRTSSGSAANENMRWRPRSLTEGANPPQAHARGSADGWVGAVSPQRALRSGRKVSWRSRRDVSHLPRSGELPPRTHPQLSCLTAACSAPPLPGA